MNKNEKNFPVKWEELTSPDFVKAVKKSKKVCILPLGIIEKHGSHLPLGTDLLVVRDLVVAAAKEDYVVVFPEFYVGQIDVAKPQPGTIAYSPELVWKMLDETCEEIARNGFDKIILANGHGGNIALVQYFAKTRLHKKRNYSTYYLYKAAFRDAENIRNLKKITETMPANAPGGHGGAEEASYVMVIRPDLTRLDLANAESGDDLQRLKHLTMVDSGISWYAGFPNHYSGDASYADEKYGKLLYKLKLAELVKALKEVKADKAVPTLQNQFYRNSENPLKTEGRFKKK